MFEGCCGAHYSQGNPSTHEMSHFQAVSLSWNNSLRYPNFNGLTSHCPLMWQFLWKVLKSFHTTNLVYQLFGNHRAKWKKNVFFMAYVLLRPFHLRLCSFKTTFTSDLLIWVYNIDFTLCSSAALLIFCQTSFVFNSPKPQNLSFSVFTAVNSLT